MLRPARRPAIQLENASDASVDHIPEPSFLLRAQKLSGWGNFPSANCLVARPERTVEARVSILSPAAGGTAIARGAGLAYGDAALNSTGVVIETNRLNRLLAFEATTGLLRCEAGVRLHDIVSIFVPRGYFLPVTPGTSRATVGGCIACDVHGRNHQVAGTFTDHVVQLTVALPNGGIVACSSDIHADLFRDTAGGMGMTGMILDATVRLMPIETAWLKVRNLPTRDLDDTLAILGAHTNSTYSVSWLDATAPSHKLGRGVVMLAEHATFSDLAPTEAAAALQYCPPAFHRLPFGIPSALIGMPLAKALNALIYRHYSSRAGAETIMPAGEYFYPLDAACNWNVLYGGRGFLEYQVLVPLEDAPNFIRYVLETLSGNGTPSFFTSIKLMGNRNAAPLSFPGPGFAFSVDLLAGDTSTLRMLDNFDERLARAGGRVYLAKDARLRPELIDSFYPERAKWAERVASIDERGRLSSDMSKRLQLTGGYGRKYHS